MNTRCGFIALLGRPNVGKSTLLNALVGAKVAIVSPKPQTTRRAIRGVATGDHWQLVLVDLPGVQRPLDVLTERMQQRVERELKDCDGALLVLNGEERVGPGDRFIAKAVTNAKVPITVAVNKVDQLDRPRTVLALQAAADLGLSGEIFPISASEGAGTEQLLEQLVAQLPEGPFFFDRDDLSDLPERVRIAELVREQVLHRTRNEVPHAVEVQIDEIDTGHDDLTTIRATVLVETKSQRGILIGKGGKMIKAIGTAARKELEQELNEQQIHLDLSVRVRESWRRDGGMLDRLGIE